MYLISLILILFEFLVPRYSCFQVHIFNPYFELEIALQCHSLLYSIQYSYSFSWIFIFIFFNLTMLISHKSCCFPSSKAFYLHLPSVSPPFPCNYSLLTIINSFFLICYFSDVCRCGLLIKFSFKIGSLTPSYLNINMSTFFLLF